MHTPPTKVKADEEFSNSAARENAKAKASSAAQAIAAEEARIDAAGKDEWYYTQNDNQFGPVRLAELKMIIADLSIEPPVKFVWAEGMNEWKPVYEVRKICGRPLTTQFKTNWIPVISCNPTTADQAADNARLAVELKAKAITEEKNERIKAATKVQAAASEAKLKATAEAKAVEEEAKLRALAEAQAQEEAQTKSQEEAKLRDAAKAKAAEGARFRAVIEAKANEEAKCAAVAKAKAEHEAQTKAEEEAKLRAAAEAKAAEEARLRALAEAQAKEEAKLAAAAKAKAEHEAQTKAQEEAKLRAAAAEARAAEEEAKLRATAEAIAAKEARLRELAETKAAEELTRRTAAEAKAANDQRIAALAKKSAETKAQVAETARLAEAKTKAIQDVEDKANNDAKIRAQAKAEAEELIAKTEAARLKKEASAARKAARVTAKSIWFYTYEGERLGPVNFDELRTMAAELKLNPRLDMVWKKDTSEWKTAGQIDGLFERSNVPVAAPKKSAGSTVSNILITPLPKKLTNHNDDWPGTCRRSFLLATLAFPLAWHYGIAALKPFLIEHFGQILMGKILPYIPYVPLLVLVHYSFKRLVNLGMSRWWYLAVFAPILNLWVGYRCFTCPPGYAYHKKMDSPGITLAIFYWLAILTGAWLLAN